MHFQVVFLLYFPRHAEFPGHFFLAMIDSGTCDCVTLRFKQTSDHTVTKL